MKIFRKSLGNKIVLPCLILIIAPLFSAFHVPLGKQKESKNASPDFASLRPNANEKYVIDKKESLVTWKGSMQLGSQGTHTGYAYISKGELMIEKSQLVGGTVEVDMNTITDPVHGSENNLIRHLKSDDFFDVEKFPLSTFTITNVASVDKENITITGNLTIKGITHAVTFPAKIKVRHGSVSASGDLMIDRTQWDVRYRSGKFFDNLADKAIADSIGFQLKIVANK